MADGDIGAVEGRLPLEGLSSEMVRVISCGEPEDEEAVGPAAWARTWVGVEAEPRVGGTSRQEVQAGTRDIDVS